MKSRIRGAISDAETGTVEHSIMADLRLHVMVPHLVWNVGTDGLRRFGLTDARNVVIFALDGQQRDIADRLDVSTNRPRCIISPFGSECLMKTVSTVCR
jgi:hypothetical protein